MGLRGPKPRPVAERFWPKVDKQDPCWIWTAATNGHGYGTIRDEGRLRYAHRVAYELLVGPIPDGLQIDHLCRNRACVNPSHLEPVTALENSRRGQGPGARTHCPQGHPYTPDNIYRHRGKRRCRACVLADNRRRRKEAA